MRAAAKMARARSCRSFHSYSANGPWPGSVNIDSSADVKWLPWRFSAPDVTVRERTAILLT